MQWRRQRRVTHVIGSSNHVLLLARYQDAPPGEEDEEEGLRNGYVVRGQDSEGSSRTLDRNGQIGYKPRRSYTGTTTSGYASGGSRSRRDDPPSSPAQPKIIFNEDEYTRITTPRQDVLFKKGYLSRKKPWAASTASTSATPSTTESQSASHSTADGSETNEDQQLLDRDSGGGEYPSIVEPGTQLAYGTFYDHASGYYYEYPVMLVGPPIPGQIGPSVLAAVPCGPVPLRPIEWVNPAFVPKLSGQPYCYMNYQAEPSPEPSTLTHTEPTLLTAENANGNENGSATGSVSGGSGGEEEPNEDINEEPKDDENRCFLETTSLTQQVHVPHVSQLPQQYMYPGHYMFGPSLVNVNGVTIQSGSMVRTNDVVATTTVAACAKRKKKKKRRKQRRLALGNTEDEEEEEYSSECDNGVTTTRPPWTASSATTLNRPLNPECQEFQLRTADELEASSSIADTNDADAAAALSAAPEDVVSSRPSSPSSSSTPPVEEDVRSKEINGTIFNVPTDDSETVVKDDSCCSKLASRSSIDDNTALVSLRDQSGDPENDAKGSVDDHVDPEDDDDVLENEEIVDDSENKAREQSNGESLVLDVEEVDEDIALVNGTNDDDVDLTSKVERSEYSEESRANGDVTDDEDMETRISNGLLSPEVTTRPTSPNGVSAFEISEKPSSRPISPEINRTTTPINSEIHRLPDSYESLVMKPPGVPPRRKYSNKGSKFVREPTPGPDLDTDAVNVDAEDGLRAKGEDAELVEVSSTKRESMLAEREARMDEVEQLMAAESYNNENVVVVVESEEIIEKCAVDSNEDSGFESQARLSDHPITDAVTQWLRKANSPDVFLTSTEASEEEDSETDESKKQIDEPPKNLQSNPIPALSVNDDTADDIKSSQVVSRGEFARTNDQMENSARRKKRSREIKRLRRSERKNDGKQQTRERKVVVVVSSNSRQVTEDLTVGDVGACEFTGEDSIAGMRVALSSRMISKRGDEEESKNNKRDSMVSVGGKACRRFVGDKRRESERKIIKASGAVRTFEKGEIVVSISGKLLRGGALHDHRIFDRNGVQVERVVEQNNEERLEQDDSKSVDDDKDTSLLVASTLSSIEEPDVLECWEAETVEPVITSSSRKIWQSRGVSLDGEATEEDGDEPELNRVNMELVRKYYRLARESGASVEEEFMKTSMSSSKSRTVPNSPERMIESLCSEEIPVIMPAVNEKGSNEERRKVPVEEAFEVYESCYTGKTPFVPIDTTNMKKSRSFYGQEGDGPIPCRAVCCNIQ